MDEMESLSHTKWECKYHVVFIPKCRRKTLYGELRRHLGEVFRKLAEQKESRIEEGHLLPDHVHMVIAIPPKYAVSQVVGFIKGKSAIHLARVYGERKRNFVGQHFWARGYYGRQAEAAFRAFRHRWQTDYGPMARRLERDLPELLSFFSFPRHLWKKLRTTNVIERCFVEVRRRTRPMVCLVNVKSVDRIIYSIFQRFTLEWKSRTLKLFTQAA